MFVLLAVVLVIAVLIGVLLVRDHRSRAGSGEPDHQPGQKPLDVRGDLRARAYMEGRSGTFRSSRRRQ